MPKFLKAVKVVTFNHFVVGIPFGAFTSYMFIQRGCSIGGELPTFPWVMLEILVFSLVEEIGFYYTHRFVSASIRKQ